ncbi:sigma-70 family RNA polymerase sigma factor [bacterium]|nr:MAG: sigma-70 family RNA polymerase sigma factor [bacterium]
MRDFATATPAASFEEAALAELPLLYRTARRMTRNDSDAEDLVGSALLQAAKAWDRFDGRFARAWLIQILRNVHLGELRRLRSRPQETSDLLVEPGDEGFWQEVNWRLASAQVLAELDHLPEEFRLAVALVDVEEMDHSEAAAALGVPEATLRTRLFRGRKKLRAKLAQLI